MELLSHQQKRYQKKLYVYGIIIQLASLIWLPWFLSACNLTFGMGIVFTLLILLFTLSATSQWYDGYAFPEKRVKFIFWYFWIWPTFIFQIWCIFMLPLAIILWSMMLFQSWPLHLFWLIAGCVTLFITLYGMTQTRLNLRFRHHPITLKHLPKIFHGYKIVHLSDLHISNFTRSAWLQKYIEKINHSQPDLIVITGDLLTYGDCFLPDLISLLKKLRAKDGIFCCTGNHDFYVSTDKHKLTQALNNIGIQVLENNYVTVQRQNSKLTLLGISGIVDNLKVQKEYLTQVLNKIAHVSPCRILLSHDPTTFLISKNIMDLTLAGHTHGGQMAIPFAKHWNLARIRYAFHSGLYKHNRSYLYVHRGTGTVALPFRIGVPPEIVFFTLQK